MVWFTVVIYCLLLASSLPPTAPIFAVVAFRSLLCISLKINGSRNTHHVSVVNISFEYMGHLVVPLKDRVVSCSVPWFCACSFLSISSRFLFYYWYLYVTLGRHVIDLVMQRICDAWSVHQSDCRIDCAFSFDWFSLVSIVWYHHWVVRAQHAISCISSSFLITETIWKGTWFVCCLQGHYHRVPLLGITCCCL